MFQKISSNLEKLTPQKAERLLTLNTFAAQRQIANKWVTELANIIREDLFTTGHIAIAKYENGDGVNRYLVNGQHTINAVMTANKTVGVVVDEFCCDTMEDVSLLYRQFDNHKARSLLDLVKMEMSSLLDPGTMTARVGSLIVTGAALYEGKKGVRKNFKIELLKKYLRPGLMINQILSDTDDWRKASKHLMRGPVIHAMYLTYYKNQQETLAFWVNVRDGEGLSKRSPELALRDFLKESITYGYNLNRTIKTVGPHEMTARCIRAWNLYRKRKTGKLIYMPTKPIPKAI